MPGKFEGNSDEALAERLHQLSLDGSWQTLGDVEDFGWYGLIADEERWYVLNEDSQGFVTIVEGPMTTETEVLRVWAALETEYLRYWDEHRETDA